MRYGVIASSLIFSQFIFSPLSRAATIVYSNDVFGDIEPCGCRTNPQGGMVRKANLLKRLADPSLLQLDAGDLLFPSNSIPPMLQKQSELQARYLLKAMDLVHHDAVVPGEKDYALGFKIFENLRASTHVRFIAANLVKKNGARYLAGSAIFNLKTTDGKPLRVGVFGIVGSDLKWPKELKVLPEISVSQAEVKKLKGKVDLVIALTHEGFEKDKVLASRVSGIDLIIGGHSQSFLQRPPTIGTATLLQSSFRNQYIGVVSLNSPRTPANYQLTGLDPGYDSPVDAPTAMNQLVTEFKTAIAKLNSEEEKTVQDSGGAAVSTGPKFQTFVRCAECHQKQFDFWRKTAHADALHALMDKAQDKNKECLTCHTVGLGDPQGLMGVSFLAEYASGSGTSGSRAETQDLDRYLSAIHSATSIQDEVKITAAAPAVPIKDSFSKFAHVWTPVQCENCHLPGREHPFSGTYTKTVQKSVCLNCHTSERAPGWYVHSTTGGSEYEPNWKLIEEKRASITCPAGD